jgi:hypothetical protein
MSTQQITPRKEDPGQGYRLLFKGEVLQEADEACHIDELGYAHWFTTALPGCLVGSGILVKGPYRRKLKAPDLAKPDTTVFAEVSTEACQAEAEVKGWRFDAEFPHMAGLSATQHIAALQRKIAKQKAEIARLTSALDDARAVIGYAKEVLTNS